MLLALHPPIAIGWLDAGRVVSFVRKNVDSVTRTNLAETVEQSQGKKERKMKKDEEPIAVVTAVQWVPLLYLTTIILSCFFSLYIPSRLSSNFYHFPLARKKWMMTMAVEDEAAIDRTLFFHLLFWSEGSDELIEPSSLQQSLPLAKV